MSVGQEQSDGVRTDAGWKRPVSAGGRHTPGQRLEGRLGAVLGAWLARTEGGRGGGVGSGHCAIGWRELQTGDEEPCPRSQAGA